MAQYNFEGNLSNINDRQLEFINNVVLQQGFKVDKVIFEVVGEAGDNYSSNIKRIKIEGEKPMTLIVKIASDNEIARKNMNTFISFRNEHIMYTEVLPKMVNLQISADVPEGERLKFAKCYGSLSEPPNEVIILEDLKESQYTMEDRFASLSNACVREVMKNFAIYHSLSYVLKNKDPKAYNYYKDNLLDMWVMFDGVLEINKYFDLLRESCLSVLTEEKHIYVIKGKFSNVASIAKKLSKIEYNNKYSVIQQGDSWTNNIMFRYPDQNTVESIMIDYQASSNSNPVRDIMYMVFNCTDHQTRSENFYDWLDHYHTELDKSLSNFGMKANFVYPRDQLDADMKRYGKFLLGVSVILASVLTKKTEDAAKLKESMDTMNYQDDDDMVEVATKLVMGSSDDETNIRFKNRIIGLIESFEQFGLL